MEILFVWLVCAAFAAYIASQRGASGGLWFFLGLLFGPFALLAAFAAGSGPADKREYRCSLCRNPIHFNVKMCPCGATRVVKNGKIYGPYIKGERQLIGTDPKVEAETKEMPGLCRRRKSRSAQVPVLRLPVRALRGRP